MFFKVAKHRKAQNPNEQVEPELFIVEEAELPHFLHENLKPGSPDVLIFDSIPAQNLYLVSNDQD